MNTWLSPKSLILSLLVVVGFSTTAIALETTPPKSVVDLLNQYQIPLDDVSIDIRELATTTPILQVNHQKLQSPASIIKVLTTLAALEILGPQFTWETRYYFSGRLQNGVLDGDIIMQGGGDPFLVQEKLWLHIQSLRQRGVDTINGDLVIDNTRFDLPPHDRASFDQRPQRLYNVGPDSALVNFSSNRFVIQPLNGKIEVFAEPRTYQLKIDNQIQYSRAPCRGLKYGWRYQLERRDESVVAHFTGKYSARCGQYSFGRAIFSNPEYTYRLFKQLWLDSGGTFSGKYRQQTTPDQATLLVSHVSKPLAQIIADINKYSNNVMARQLLLSVNALNEDYPANLQRSRHKITSWLDTRDIAIPELFIDNGSGLSRQTRITADGLAEILQQGWQSDYAAEFLASFSLVGLDGTTRKRFTDSPLVGRARIKTGFIKGVRSLAGYVHAKNNKYYSVTMVINSPRITFSSGGTIQDALLRWLYFR